MTTYKVTLELKTSWWKHLFRFFRLIAPRKEFEIVFSENWFKTNDVLNSGNCNIKIIKCII